MSHDVIAKYQIAGLDERERGFSRLMDMERIEGNYRAVLRYEKTIVETDRCATSDAALNHLIELLRERGYSQLKSRLDFRGTDYLGSREFWVEYPDPDRPSQQSYHVPQQLARRTGWLSKVLKLFSW